MSELDDITTYCAKCGRELATPEAFPKEYEYCRTYCCKCCPDGKKKKCQKDKLDKFDLVDALARARKLKDDPS